MIDLRSLQCFRSTALTGSVRGAADALGMAPSAVSQHVRALERSLGIELFVRRGRRLRLSPEGRRLLGEAEAVFTALGALEDRAADLRSARSRRLTIGYISSAGTPWMADLVAYLENRHPDLSVRLELTEGDVDDDGPDLQLVVSGEHGLTLPGGMESELLVVDPYVAAVPREHPLAAAPAVRVTELAAVPWIDNDDTGPGSGRCRQVFVDACRTAGVEPVFRHEAHDYRTALEMADRGLGATILPRLAAGAAGPGLVLVPFVDPGLRRVIHLVWRGQGPDGRVIADARRALHELVAQGQGGAAEDHAVVGRLAAAR